jgi:hypothetical protein
MTAWMIATATVVRSGPGAALPTILSYALPFLIAGLCIGMGWLMGVQSGWYDLARRFPNRTDPPITAFKYRSGWFKQGVAFNGILHLYVCRAGLRVGVVRIFGPFSNDFFVPWEEITVTRGRQWLQAAARLQLADAGSLSLRAPLADALARAAGDLWPEPGPFPVQSQASVGRAVLVEWAIFTGIGAVLLIVIPRAVAPHGPWPPLPFAIGVPALLSGIGAVFEFTIRSGRNRRALKEQGPADKVDAPPPGA